MIKGFEHITKPLNNEDMKILNILVHSFSTRPKGEEHAITSGKIIKAFKEAGISLNGVKLRKIIQHIRVNGILTGLCSNSDGYYICATEKELKDTLDSLYDRIVNQSATYHALRAQYKELYLDNKEDKPKNKPLWDDQVKE